MTKSTKVISLTFLLLGSPVHLFADRAHDLANQAASQRTATCTGSLNSQTCHNQFPTGCTNTTKPYDAYLNFLKNQTPGPNLPSTALLNRDNFQKLETQIPSGLQNGKHAQFASNLAGLGEGNIVTVIGYLYFAQDTSKGGSGQPAPGETANCKLQLPDSYDFHLGIGFDAALAQQLRATKPKSDIKNPGNMEKTSVVAEMTPHTRHPKWTFNRVNSLQGQQVKVVGQLMLDNLHFNKRDDCSFPQAASTCWRSTIWEVHPVTQFYVCNLSAGCDKSSPDSAWTSLDNVP